MRLLFSLVDSMQINGCVYFRLRSVTGFKLVFQSKYLRMDVAACVVHVLIQFLVRKEKASSCTKCFYGIFRIIDVLPHMRILSHTRMGRPIRVWDIPYAYGTILCPIRVWASHMSMHA